MRQFRKNIDYSLYVIIDDTVCSINNMLEISRKLVNSGITCVQLRMKKANYTEIIIIGTKLLELLKPQGIPLIINDHVKLIKIIGADGVHIGQKDMPYHE